MSKKSILWGWMHTETKKNGLCVNEAKMSLWMSICIMKKKPHSKDNNCEIQITSFFHGNISSAANTGVNKRTCDGACHETVRLSTSFNAAIILQLGKLVSDPEYEHHYPETRKKTDYIVLLTPLTDKRWILIKRVKRTIKMKRTTF